MTKSESVEEKAKSRSESVDSTTGMVLDSEEEVQSGSPAKKESGMDKVLNDSQNPPSIDDVVEGTVLGIGKAKVFIDIPPFGTGIIYGREYINARDIIKKINVGDTVAGKVVSLSNKDGYIEISLKEARQALIWSEAEAAILEKKIFELPVQEANKGGLILSWQGISGFLPASQLKTEHYPRVADGDKDRILEELRKLVGQKISVAIIGVSPKEGKLIFSEKNPEQKNKDYIIDKYVLGDVVTGEVTGVVDFGVLASIEEGIAGLVHISEFGSDEKLHDALELGKSYKFKITMFDAKEQKMTLSFVTK